MLNSLLAILTKPPPGLGAGIEATGLALWYQNISSYDIDQHRIMLPDDMQVSTVFPKNVSSNDILLMINTNAILHFRIIELCYSQDLSPSQRCFPNCFSKSYHGFCPFSPDIKLQMLYISSNKQWFHLGPQI